MFRGLLQRLTGRGSPVEEEAAAEERSREIHEERVDAAAGMVGGAGVMPDGDVADFDADEQAPG